MRAPPDFVIIGTQRGGTSSLYWYLIQHPMIAPAARKEAHYFDLHYDRGIDWYLREFPEDRPRGVLTGEASPYYMFHPCAAERCARDLPEAKIVALLRNPVDRAYSHYHHEVRKGREELSFEDALEAEEERLAGEREKLLADPSYRSEPWQRWSYQARGRYAEQLEVWREKFEVERMLIVESEKMFADPAGVCGRVLEFLGLPPASGIAYRRRNEGSYEPMAEETRRRLAASFRVFPVWYAKC